MKSQAQKLLCLILAVSMVVIPVSQGWADHLYKTRPYAQREREAPALGREEPKSSGSGWAAVIVGVAFFVLASLGASSTGAGSGNGGSDAAERYRYPAEKNRETPSQDNGAGCFWGYGSLGTCR